MVTAKTKTIPDSNVVLDLLQPQQSWSVWSQKHLAACALDGSLVVNAIIFAEVSGHYLSHQEVSGILQKIGIDFEDIPLEAAYHGGRAHKAYRRAGGKQDRLLPDFLIGSHAQFRGYSLLTRDQARFRTYFPYLHIIAPDTHP